MPDDAGATVQAVLASARSEWVRSTARLEVHGMDDDGAEPLTLDDLDDGLADGVDGASG